jgi:putative PIN family toxin of toxin-antitoxin system
MVAKKKRVAVVLDTNVLIRNFHSSNPASPNKRVFRIWWQVRQLQLIVSTEVLNEYIMTFRDVLELDPEGATVWHERFETDSRCTLVNLGRRFTESRDPDDNVFLATAAAGSADYLITNDRDLLDLPPDFQKKLPFAIVTPKQFLDEWGKK